MSRDTGATPARSNLQLVGPRTIGTQLREARLRMGLLQGQAAEGICSGGYLSRVERGERQPSPAILAALLERLTPGATPAGAPSNTALHSAAASSVAEAADHWLAYPTDRGAFGRLVDAVDWWRRTSSTTVHQPSDNSTP